MKFLKSTLAVLILSIISMSCDEGEKADMIITNTTIYTVDADFSKVNAVAIKNDKIMAVGSVADIEAYEGPETQVIDLTGKYVYPGFVEGHAHIMGVGQNLLNVDLMNTTSYEEIVEMVAERAKDVPPGEWILGRGWHQDKWVNQPEGMFRGFPTHDLLSEAVPDNPVYLRHASGHAGLANAKAMEMAGIDADTDDPDGGEVFKGLDGRPTGIFNETAQGMIGKIVPVTTKERATQALELAIQSCLENGITAFHQAGSPSADVALFREFAEQDKLKIRLYVMLSGRDGELLNEYFESGPYIDPQLTIRSVKLYSDGALGSRGAWLLEEYTDAPGKFGHNVTPMENIENVTMSAIKAGFQVCTHAIGDRGNREVLDIYEKAFNAYPEMAKDHRFRIEHAQHIDGEDIPRFAELGVIPSMQAIHMSSDRPWAIDRLGKERIEEGAYVWQTLLQQGSRIVNGTDAPVEPISPTACFYASVSRRTLKGTPDGGYEPDQRMTREQALRSYTLDAAYAAFNDEIKGSVEVGKLADFTVLDRDIMIIPEDEILDAKVEMTVIGGKVMFEAQ
jgi:hypothetical protein